MNTKKNALPSVFITGTDTGVGKTVVTGLLYRYLLRRGYNAVTQKWIQSGSGQGGGDVKTHLRLAGRKPAAVNASVSELVPYSFIFPASPHLASRLERSRVSSSVIIKHFSRLRARYGCVLVEGVGGALVPFTKKRLVIDIAAELRLPVIIVAKNKLGAINHTLLTIEALRRRRMEILGIIFNGAPARTPGVIIRDNPKIIRSLSGVRILGHIPLMEETDRLHKRFTYIGKRLIHRMKGLIT